MAVHDRDAQAMDGHSGNSMPLRMLGVQGTRLLPWTHTHLQRRLLGKEFPMRWWECRGLGCSMLERPRKHGSLDFEGVACDG